MNKRTISITTAVTSTLFTAGLATADFQGFSVDESNEFVGGTTYRVYANVDAGDQVNAIFGDGVDPLSIDSGGFGFYQNMFGSHRAPDSSLFPFFPSLEYDSFVTIGLCTSTGNAMLDIGIDWTIFEGDVLSGSHWNGGDIFTDNGSWFATPDDVQVFEVGGRVKIGQFTIDGGEGVHGIVNILGKNADGTSWQYRGVEFPAPGAFVLLGLAGVATRRRRT